MANLQNTRKNSLVDSALMTRISAALNEFESPALAKVAFLRFKNQAFRAQIVNSAGNWQLANPLPTEDTIGNMESDLWFTVNLMKNDSKDGALCYVKQGKTPLPENEIHTLKAGRKRRSNQYLIFKMKIEQYKSDLTGDKFLDKNRDKNSGKNAPLFVFVAIAPNEKTIFLKQAKSSDSFKYNVLNDDSALAQAIGEDWKDVLTLQIKHYIDLCNVPELSEKSISSVPYVEEYATPYGAIIRLTGPGKEKLYKLGRTNVLDYDETKKSGKMAELRDFCKKTRKDWRLSDVNSYKGKNK